MCIFLDRPTNETAELPPGSNIISVIPSGVSAWVETVRIEARLKDGRTRLYFMKSQSGETGRRMMEGTFYSENLLHSYIPDHVPRPHAWGQFKSDPSTYFYLCDFHEMTQEVPEVRSFVSIIAKLHKDSMGKETRFGLDLTTHLANRPNDNTWQDSWEAWYTQALRKMFEIEELSHGQNNELDLLKQEFFAKVIPRLLRPLETGGRSIEPCLIHSDLWPGNCMPDDETGQIIIFDSCVFWGHNEVDLGSWRAPRYKMGEPFLKEYQEIMGTSKPHDDWDDRNALYALRYDLLHAALFPKTDHGLGFRKSAMAEMKRLIEKHPTGLEGFKE